MSGNEKTNTLILMLIGVVALLMVAIIGLFVRMNQLQNEILTSLASLQTGETQAMGLAVGTHAPAFTLPAVDGSMISLQDFAAQRVLLGFSSIQCPACTQMYPSLKAFSRQRQDIQIILISRGTFEENQQLAEVQGFSFPVLTLTEDNLEVGQDYQVPGTPFFYVINEQGIVCNTGFANTQEHLESLLNGCRQ